MSYTTYSFSDVSVVFSHPSIGQYIASGEGIGSIAISMSTDRTSHDIAGDGSVMVSKIKGRNGTIAIEAQQTSSLQKWLLKAYNYLESAKSSDWARMSVVVRSPMMQELDICTGVSFNKIPDNVRQAQGQKRTWTLMAADIQQEVA